MGTTGALIPFVTREDVDFFFSFGDAFAARKPTPLCG